MHSQRHTSTKHSSEWVSDNHNNGNHSPRRGRHGKMSPEATTPDSVRDAQEPFDAEDKCGGIRSVNQLVFQRRSKCEYLHSDSLVYHLRVLTLQPSGSCVFPQAQLCCVAAVWCVLRDSFTVAQYPLTWLHELYPPSHPLAVTDCQGKQWHNLINCVPLIPLLFQSKSPPSAGWNKEQHLPLDIGNSWVGSQVNHCVPRALF